MKQKKKNEKDIQILYSKMEDLIQVKRKMFQKHKGKTDMLNQIQTESEGKSQNQNNDDCDHFFLERNNNTGRT